MDTDKNQNILEKQLKTLGQKVRIDILKKLKHVQTPLSFSKLQKEVLVNDFTSVNLSFHLNTLKKSDLIQSSEEGYSITLLGEQIIERILSIEQILNKQSKALMIRTSKYSKEIFDINKIEDYLVKEGELERYLARQIAHEVEDRLSKTNIEYMTAPLMREYINAVLLENGLEEVRHKLTRLGTPPFEVFKLFNSSNTEINPEKFIKKLGSDVSEQFLLLNLLPKKLADLYLSGEIALLHLNYWGLRPLSLYMKSETLFNYLLKSDSNNEQKITKTNKNTRFIIKFFDLLQQLKQFYSEDLVLGNFNNQFISFLTSPKIESFYLEFFISQILQFNKLINDGKSHLSLEFNYNGKKIEDLTNQLHKDIDFLNFLDEKSKDHIRPFFIFEGSKIITSKSGNGLKKQLFEAHNRKNIVFYNQNYSNLMNSCLVQIPFPQYDQVILDKILVNLHMISVEVKQNDDLFFELLHDKLISIFKLFNIKENLVEKKLNSLKQWNFIVTRIFNKNKSTIFKNAIKSISFFGLNEAILNHCGIELDRTENSENFALKILKFMKKIINEKNEGNNNTFILSVPHRDSYLRNSWNINAIEQDLNLKEYSTNLIRETSNLSLMKKIGLYKKFQKVFNGGIFFMEQKPNDLSFEKYLKTLIQSNINAFSLKDSES